MSWSHNPKTSQWRFFKTNPPNSGIRGQPGATARVCGCKCVISKHGGPNREWQFCISLSYARFTNGSRSKRYSACVNHQMALCREWKSIYSVQKADASLLSLFIKNFLKHLRRKRKNNCLLAMVDVVILRLESAVIWWHFWNYKKPIYKLYFQERWEQLFSYMGWGRGREILIKINY